MIRFSTLLTLAILLAAPSLMTAQGSKAEQEVLATLNQLNAAVVKADVATLDKIAGEDLSVISGFGDVATKTEYLDLVRSGKHQLSALEDLGSKIRVYGNLAVASQLQKTTGKAFGHEITSQVRQTNVFVKRGGRWQLVQRQSTLVPSPRADAAARGGSKQGDLASVSLVGTYKLVSHVVEIENEPARLGLDEGAPGYLVITPKYLITLYTAKERKAGTSDQEKAALWQTMSSYSGTYEIEGDKITYSVDVSWNQSWNGTKQVRFFKVDGNHLTMKSLPMIYPRDPSKKSVATLVWEKVE